MAQVDWKKKYEDEVAASQEFYEWAMNTIKSLEKCSPEAFEFRMEKETERKIDLKKRILADHKKDKHLSSQLSQEIRALYRSLNG